MAGSARQENIFLDDWRNCLYAHYRHVISEQDDLNESSLHRVLNRVGFTDVDLQSIRDGVMLPVIEQPAEPEPPAPETPTATVAAEPAAIIAEPAATVAETHEAAPESEPPPPPEPEEPPATQLSLF